MGLVVALIVTRNARRITDDTVDDSGRRNCATRWSNTPLAARARATRPLPRRAHPGRLDDGVAARPHPLNGSLRYGGIFPLTPAQRVRRLT